MAVLLSACALPASFAGPRLIRAGFWLAPDGELKPGAALLLDAGQIQSVGRPESIDAPDGVPIDEYPGAVLTPGLIDTLGSLSAFGNLSDALSPQAPELQAADAFDRFSTYLRPALEAGVTTFGLAPTDTNIVAGQVALCQTSGPAGAGRVLSAAGPVKLTLSPAALLAEREPTSRAGAIGLLRETLSAARNRQTAHPALAELVRGARQGVFVAPSGADVLVALDLAETHRLKLSLVHTDDAREIAEEVAAARQLESGGAILGVIVGPLSLTSSERTARAAGLFERAGVPVALVAGLPESSADGLRIAAGVAVRAGLSPEAGRRAITATAAELLGLDRGVLRAGQKADLVIWTGDPLDLRSRVLAVYVEGVRVYRTHDVLDTAASGSAARGVEVLP